MRRKYGTETIRVCDTKGCGSADNVTAIQEGDFCEPCLDGQRYANEVTRTYREPTPDQQWGEILDNSYQYWLWEY